MHNVMYNVACPRHVMNFTSCLQRSRYTREKEGLVSGYGSGRCLLFDAGCFWQQRDYSAAWKLIGEYLEGVAKQISGGSERTVSVWTRSDSVGRFSVGFICTVRASSLNIQNTHNAAAVTSTIYNPISDNWSSFHIKLFLYSKFQYSLSLSGLGSVCECAVK